MERSETRGQFLGPRGIMNAGGRFFRSTFREKRLAPQFRSRVSLYRVDDGPSYPLTWVAREIIYSEFALKHDESSPIYRLCFIFRASNLFFFAIKKIISQIIY